MTAASVSVTVMAHPARAAHVAPLLAALDRPARVVWDRFGDRHDTGSRALAAHDPDATHHLVVQDDAVVCRDLVAGVERALSHVPDDTPLVLYVGRVRPFAGAVTQLVEQANTGPTSFLTMPDLNWGVGVVMPTGHIDECLDWYSRTKIKNYDMRLSRWYRQRETPVWYTWPSLVDHLDGPSLVPGHGVLRHAHRFVGAECSALDVDWSGRVVEMTTRPASDAARHRRTVRR